jgi:two-component system, NarL family, nitrate/nitrite sensor histidine kinase NarX
VSHLLDENRQLSEKLALAEKSAGESGKRLAAIFRLRQQFMEARDEKDVFSAALPLAVQFAEALGASFVPLDEHRQPLPAFIYGTIPPDFSDDWVEYLASPVVRDRCKACEKGNHFSVTCPLFEVPFQERVGIYCLPLLSGEREFGVFNLYLPHQNGVDPETCAFLKSILDETAQTLESLWLRKRELGALQQIQAARQKADLTAFLPGLLENICKAIEADFVSIVIQPDSPAASSGDELIQEDGLVIGYLPITARNYLAGLVKRVLLSGESLLLGDTFSDPAAPPDLGTAIVVPLVIQDQPPLGVLLAGHNQVQNFHRRHLTLLQAVAAQTALVIQNNRQLAEFEYKKMIEERTRLSREIHDGLAQTLGFLKLQVAQMQGYLERGDTDRLRASVQTCHQTLSEAYQDARNAIDGLRISPTDHGIEEWLPQMLSDFQENVGPEVKVTLEAMQVQVCLPLEIQAQLIRIFQEALSNIRKHAGAKNVWVKCGERNEEFFLEIRDDGQGFVIEEVPAPAQHGLRGMRERVELIGGNLQVVSHPFQGTTVCVVLPVKTGDRVL